MREPVRAYLMAGLSTVAVGAIIAAPMSPLSPHIASPQPQVRTNDVQLAALSTPLTPRTFADQPAVLRVLAEVSRGLESTKAAKAASSRAHPLLASAVPAAAQPSTGVVTAHDPATTASPATDDRHSSTAPRRAAVNAIDAPAIANVLAQTATLIIDTVVGQPAFFVSVTALDVGNLLVAVASLDPDTINNGFQAFIDTESSEAQGVFATLGFDVQGLQDAVGHLFGVDQNATAVKLAKTTTPPATAGAAAEPGAAEPGAAEPGAAESGATAPTKPRRHLAGIPSKVHDVAGKGAQHESSGSAQDPHKGAINGGTATTGTPAEDASGSSNSQPTDPQANDTSDTKNGKGSEPTHITAKPATPSKTKVADHKPGATSGPSHTTTKPGHTTHKADHTGGQAKGNTSKSDAKHAKHGG